ncbi:MAG: DNA-binding protein [Gammaproteobacteria bacterium]
MSEATLERWLSEGIGPRFLKLCGRVLYRQVDIEAYEESCLVTSTRSIGAQTSVD